MNKIILLGICFLFLTTSISSSAIGGNKNFKNDLLENPEIESSDNDREVITFIGGWFDPLKVKFEGEYYFEFWDDEGIRINGIKHRTFLPGVRLFSKNCKHVIAPYFIVIHYFNI